jgi:hypothetical protein
MLPGTKRVLPFVGGFVCTVEQLIASEIALREPKQVPPCPDGWGTYTRAPDAKQVDADGCSFIFFARLQDQVISKSERAKLHSFIESPNSFCKIYRNFLEEL